jgi:hypothetical protein
MVFRVSAQTAEFLRETRDTTGALVFGRRTFDHLGTGPIDLERTRVIGAAGMTHPTFRVV